VERVLDLLSWGREHVSLATPVDEDGDTSLGDLMAQETAPGPDLTVLDTEARDRLNQLVDQLDERAADIVRARYGLVDGRQHKLADIGVKHGISAERVRQLEREALQKLRRLGDPDLASGSAA
ncbi:MAG: RNA polymerase subunit sigma, partial [Nocardioidaceae bacterium]|nr:RNA polymerase subunit sigma [Nocardioidaceae bacterium]